MTVVAELALQYIIALCSWLKEQFQVSILVARVQSREELSAALVQFLLPEPIRYRRVKICFCLLADEADLATYLDSRLKAQSRRHAMPACKTYLNTDVMAEVLVGHEKTVWFGF